MTTDVNLRFTGDSRDAVRAANAAGSLSVGAIGARAGMPSRTTIEEALAR